MNEEVAIFVAEQEFELASAVFRPDKSRRILALLQEEGVVAASQVHAPRLIRKQELLRVHTPSYLERLRSYAATVPAYAVAELEIPLNAASLRAAELACGASLEAARHALATGGIAVHLGGGFHHAFAGHGEGFCLLHDIAVALRALLGAEQAPSLSRALIIDLDAHQGNGTARLFQGEPRVFTFSIHNAEIYPHPKETSDLDVPLPAGTGDEAYLAALDEGMARAWREAGLDEPPAAEEGTLVVVLAGVDPYHDDLLGGLALTRNGLRERTRRVLEAARRRRHPVLIVQAGGYARDREELIELHADTVRAAACCT